MWLRVAPDPLIGVSIESDRGVDALLNHAGRFDEPLRIRLDDGVSDRGARRLCEALTSGRLTASSLDCYARITSQGTLDALIEADPPLLLIGRPALEACDLAALGRTNNLAGLWLVEDDSTVPSDDESSVRRGRYAEQGLSAIASASSLRLLMIVGIDVTDTLAEDLSKAKQLDQLLLRRVALSDSAEHRLRTTLTTTEIDVRRLDGSRADAAADPL